MKVAYSKTFMQQAKRLRPAVRDKIIERATLFINNPLHPQLRNHALKGKYKQYRSIDITGDIRALYTQQDDQAIFDLVDIRSQLYG